VCPSKNKKDNQITAEEILQAREKIDLTVDQFALLLNVSTRTVQRWEKEGAEVGQSAGVAQLISLYQMLQNDDAFNEFMKLKGNLMGAKSSLAPFGTAAITALSSALPMFGMFAGGALGSLIAPTIIESLQKFVDKNSDKKS